MAMSQEDYMRALVGDDNNLWKPLPGFFTPGTPLYTEAGGEILKGPATSMRQEASGGKRLFRPAGHLPRGAGPANHQDPGDVTADFSTSRHER